MADDTADDHAAVVARRVVVTGRVQGVGFRVSTARTARAAGLVGWVRNLPDGGVEAHLQGGRGDVDRVLSWMRAGGPPAARVANLTMAEVDPATSDGFHVTH